MTVHRQACGRITCECIQGASFCTPGKIIDLTPILGRVKGPGEIKCKVKPATGGGDEDRGEQGPADENALECKFKETTLNDFFQGGLPLSCLHAQCLYEWEIPTTGLFQPGPWGQLWKLTRLFVLLGTSTGALLLAGLFLGSLAALYRTISAPIQASAHLPRPDCVDGGAPGRGQPVL